MGITQVEKSNYYKGLLILIGKDRIIDSRERELMLEIGKILDFERRFCEAAIDDLLRNTHIADDPVTFTGREIAESFVRDAVGLALVDEELHPHELAWLKAVARANGLTDAWLEEEIRIARADWDGSKPAEALQVVKHL